MPPSDPSPEPKREPITDSPWFWLSLFLGMAVLGVAVIGPKYARRQQALERREEGRENAWRHRVGDMEMGVTVVDLEDDPDPRRRILLPLMGLLTLGLVAAVVSQLALKARRRKRELPSEE